jgi:transposase InsO family protein
MKNHEKKYSVMRMAKALRVSRSGYYAWKKRKMSLREESNLRLAEEIKKIFDKHRERYGSPRIWAELRERGWLVSRNRVAKLMRKLGLRAGRKVKWVKTTDTNHNYKPALNILNQEFRAAYPGEKWVSDITYLRTSCGWLYLTVIIDLWDRKVIGWSIAEDLTAKQVCLAFAMAVGNRPPLKELIFHSDRGVQYCSEEFRSTLYQLCPSARQSMSRKGNCWDNACAESFFKTLKSEMEILGRRYTKKEIKTALFEYIEIYYNRCRRRSALGYATPIALTNNIAA